MATTHDTAPDTAIPLSEFASDPQGYITHHLGEEMTLLQGAPLLMSALMLLAAVLAWWLARWYDKRALSEVPVLRTQLEGERRQVVQQAEEITHLRAQLTTTPSPSGIFEVEARDCFFSWVNTNREESPVHPDIPKPPEVSLLIRITAVITAIPTRTLSMVELEILRKRYSQVIGSWEPHFVGPVSFERYLHFELPPTVPSGSHSAKLIAYSNDFEKTSIPFDIQVPR
jgi:hypothetical protein